MRTLNNNTTDYTFGCWVYATTGYYNNFSTYNNTGNGQLVDTIDLGLLGTNNLQVYFGSNTSRITKIYDIPKQDYKVNQVQVQPL